MLARGIQLTWNSFWEDTENVNQLAAILEHNFSVLCRKRCKLNNQMSLLPPAEVTQNALWGGFWQAEGNGWEARGEIKQQVQTKGALWLPIHRNDEKTFQNTSTKVLDWQQTALCSSKAIKIKSPILFSITLLPAHTQKPTVLFHTFWRLSRTHSSEPSPVLNSSEITSHFHVPSTGLDLLKGNSTPHT